MSNSFQNEIARIWHKAVDLYKHGYTDSKSFPIDVEIPLLKSFGVYKMDVFDYAEDWCLHQEPDLLTFILIHYERWKFFTEVQNGVHSTDMLDPSTLPSKQQTAGGIAWLPRILVKARAKLRGELPPTVMYGCGGDRHFFQTNHIHPAQFLSLIRRLGNDEQAIIEWVVTQKNIFTS